MRTSLPTYLVFFVCYFIQSLRISVRQFVSSCIYPTSSNYVTTHPFFPSCFARPSTSCKVDRLSSIFVLGYIWKTRFFCYKLHRSSIFGWILLPSYCNIECRELCQHPYSTSTQAFSFPHPSRLAFCRDDMFVLAFLFVRIPFSFLSLLLG